MNLNDDLLHTLLICSRASCNMKWETANHSHILKQPSIVCQPEMLHSVKINKLFSLYAIKYLPHQKHFTQKIFTLTLFICYVMCNFFMLFLSNDSSFMQNSRSLTSLLSLQTIKYRKMLNNYRQEHAYHTDMTYHAAFISRTLCKE
jgi:hypothetical protein